MDGLEVTEKGEKIAAVLGGGGMLFLAAMVEGFWSSRRELGDDVRYAFGVIMWVVWALYFLLVGRGMERSRIDDP